MAEYSKEELKELYDQLPEDLQEAVFSKEIGQKVQGICYDNNVIERKDFMEILKNVGYVFLGLLDPEGFKKNLKKLKIRNIEEIAARINNEVFIELRESLEALYNIKIGYEKSKRRPVEKTGPKKHDKYLELIE